MRYDGYTLIELLLVIAILSILSSLAIATYRDHQIQHRLEKMALEMQNIAEAALNFQADQGHWPKAHNTFPDCATKSPDKTIDNTFLAYLPNASSESGFGNYYCWSNIGASGSLFFVALKIPKNNGLLAKRIAAELPNAVSTSAPMQQEPEPCNPDQDCYVRLEVSGNNSAHTPSLSIAGYGDCMPEKRTQGSDAALHCQYLGLVGSKEPKTVNYLISFTCPTNEKGDLHSSVNFLDVGTASGDPYILKTLTLSHHCTTDENQHIACTLSIDAARAMGWSVASGAHGHIGASYTAYCLSIPKPSYTY